MAAAHQAVLNALLHARLGPLDARLDRAELAELEALGGAATPPLPLACSVVPLGGFAPRLRSRLETVQRPLVLVELALKQHAPLEAGLVRADGAVTEIQSRGRFTGLVAEGEVAQIAFRLRFVIDHHGQASQGAPPPPDEPEGPGQLLPGARAEQIDRWAALSGDHAPEHLSLEAARRAGLPAPSVPGMLALTWVLAGTPAATEVYARFRRPLLLGRPTRLERRGHRLSLRDAEGPVLTVTLGPRSRRS